MVAVVAGAAGVDKAAVNDFSSSRSKFDSDMDVKEASDDVAVSLCRPRGW